MTELNPDRPLALTDLVPLETLDKLRRLFKVVVGVPMVFTDSHGAPVTEVDDTLQYCGTLVHDPAGGSVCLRRKKWDEPEPAVEERILRQHEGTKPVAHRCMGGFEDTAVPIVVNEQTLGFAVFARTLTASPDVEAFRRMAVAGGMPVEMGEAVAEHAVVMPPERVAHVAEFLQVIANLVARAAYDTLRARRVLELEKLRDDLTHMIVHDLRTPLTSIMGGLQTIEHLDYDPETTREFIPIALSSAETLLEMINTLLDIGKFESGEMKLSLGPVDVTQVTQTALDQVRGLAEMKRQELAAELDPACPLVEGDQELLRRVAVNLLGNAIKFTQDGGRIELAARCEGDDLVISVRDNGPGIPPEYQRRIFEKFGQVEAAGARQKHSTGLGLTFCQMVAEAHGGRIELESEVGKGSTFRVRVPVRRGG